MDFEEPSVQHSVAQRLTGAIVVDGIALQPSLLLPLVLEEQFQVR